MWRKGLPHFAEGEVVKGFGRGSKQLGIPTANYPLNVVNALPIELETGIYCGYASVDDGPVHDMVMSIGWNPYYKNEHKSMETHIIHKFDNDFYGKSLKVLIVDYIRPEKNFSSLEDLITAINLDIEQAKQILRKPEFEESKNKYF